MKPKATEFDLAGRIIGLAMRVHSTLDPGFIKKAAAFTMLELLVAMAVLSLLVVLLLSMVDNATKMWRQSENRVDAYREARAALNVIASDLASIYTSANTNFFRINDSTVSIQPTSTSSTNNIFFIAALPAAAQDVGKNKSDLCEVGYFVTYNSTSLLGADTNRSMNLYRYFRSSDDTFTSLGNNQIVSNAISTGSTGEEVLAKNVTDFKIEAYTVSTNTPPTIQPFTQTATTPTPDILEITLSAISNEAAKRFVAQADWSDTNSITYKENVRTFTKRVVLPKPVSIATPTPSPTP